MDIIETMVCDECGEVYRHNLTRGGNPHKCNLSRLAAHKDQLRTVPIHKARQTLAISGNVFERKKYKKYLNRKLMD